MSSIFTTTYTRLDPDTYIYITWAVFLILTVLVGYLWRHSKRRWIKWATAAPLLFLWLVFLYGTYIGVNEFKVRYLLERP